LSIARGDVRVDGWALRKGAYGTIVIDLERRPIDLLTDCSTESWAT